MSFPPELYLEHRAFLWGYCYRLLGLAADAEDVVQETFVRALERPPADQDRPWRPWLLRVASNLALDLLRRRRRRPYDGPWLPSPVEPAEQAATGAEAHTGARAELGDSLSYAFLIALETLTPQQRAVLLLRQIYDCSTEETAGTLGLTAANVKVTLLRARRALGEARLEPLAKRLRPAGQALERLLDCLRRQDLQGLESLLAHDVVAWNDGGGAFHAARKPVRGAATVARFFANLRPGDHERVNRQAKLWNGLPGLLVERPDAPPGLARRFALLLDVDAEGRIVRLWTVLNPAKLPVEPQGTRSFAQPAGSSGGLPAG